MHSKEASEKVSMMKLFKVFCSLLLISSSLAESFLEVYENFIGLKFAKSFEINKNSEILKKVFETFSSNYDKNSKHRETANYDGEVRKKSVSIELSNILILFFFLF